MESKYQESGDGGETERNALDRELDAALARYSAVQPRAGLEQRIQACLRFEQNRIPNRSWWQGSAFVAAAALLAITAAFIWKAGRPAKTVAQHTSAPIEAVDSSSERIATKNQINPLRPFAARQPNKAPRHIHEPSVVADAPKLDQFPSPRPLSEQEKLALEYVERFPGQASLLAQAQSNFARQQDMEERQAQTSSQ